MNIKFVAACLAGALLGSAVMLAQAGPPPDYNGTLPDKCVGDGNTPPSWDNVDHHPLVPWCCYVTSSGGSPTSEKVRYSNGLPVIGTMANNQCKAAPP
jgi:hypothetical protein